MRDKLPIEYRLANIAPRTRRPQVRRRKYAISDQHHARLDALAKAHGTFPSVVIEELIELHTPPVTRIDRTVRTLATPEQTEMFSLAEMCGDIVPTLADVTRHRDATSLRGFWGNKLEKPEPKEAVEDYLEAFDRY